MITVISGGQTGADEAALVAAKEFSLETGGWMPLGFKTLMGNKPQFATLYGMKEHSSSNYRDRTWDNVSLADATIRFAGKWGSSGEKCTFNAIKHYEKPYFDVSIACLDRHVYDMTPEALAEWIRSNGYKVVNVAGNAERTYPGTFKFTYEFLCETFILLGYKRIKNANLSSVPIV